MEPSPWIDIGLTAGVGLVIAIILWVAIKWSRK